MLSRSFWSLIVTSSATGVSFFFALSAWSKSDVTRISVPSSREATFEATLGSLTSVRIVCGLASTTILQMVSADSSGLGSSQNSFTSFSQNRHCLRDAASIVDYLDEASSHDSRLGVLEHVSPNGHSRGSCFDRV